MKNFTSIVLSVFAKPEEDAMKLKQGLLALVPFHLEDEKIPFEEQRAQGFNQRTIHVFTLALTKDRHINAFMEFLLGKLNNQQKHQLIAQAETRLDPELMFFIRIDKDLWANDHVLQLTDSGNCFHIKLHVASFPRKREVALDIVTKVFKSM